MLAGKAVGVQVGLGSHAIALPPIVTLGTAEQRHRFVPPVLAGEKIAALADHRAGRRLRRRRHHDARRARDGDKYVVNGARPSSPRGVRADFVTVAVRTGGPGHGGVSLLVIERGTPGFAVSQALEKMGWWASDTAELVVRRLPRAGGQPDRRGERRLRRASCRTSSPSGYPRRRSASRSPSSPIARRAPTRSERQAFGKPLVGFQVTRHKLADMATRIAAARALTGEVAVRYVARRACTELAAMAKNTATDMCSFVVDQAVQIHGGAGYMRGDRRRAALPRRAPLSRSAAARARS